MAIATAMFGDDEFRRMSKMLAEQMKALTEPSRRMQEQIAAISKAYTSPMLEMQQQIQAMFEPYHQMQKSIEQVTRQLSAPLMAHRSAMKSLTKVIAPILDSQRLFQQSIAKQISDVMAPSAQLREQMAAMVSQVALARDNSFVQAAQALSTQLHGYEPSIEETEDGLVIDGEAYTRSAIEQAFTQHEILTKPSSWASLPPKLQWLLMQILLPIILSLVGNFIWTQAQYANWVHQQKTEIRHIKSAIKAAPRKECLPFISKDDLPVHASSKRHSRVLAYLPFQAEVQILEYRKKKRWLLIEWQDGNETHRGWVLGRYVFRPSKYRRAN